jgi:N-acetylneuraminate lyase
MSNAPHQAITGLVAAVHTPLNANGDLHLDAVPAQAAFLLERGVSQVFVAGSTGEGHSLSMDERKRLLESWLQLDVRGQFRIIAHVGCNSLRDARELAAHAGNSGADGVAALSPSYFKPASIEALVDSMQSVADAAPNQRFYYYDIPAMTGVTFPEVDTYRALKSRIANFAGVKYTNGDLVALQRILQAFAGEFDVLFGADELLLPAMALGARGAVGSGYNFAAPIYHRIMREFETGDLDAARRWQCRGVTLVDVLSSRGYMASAKAMMELLGVPVGPPRLPFKPLSASERQDLERDLKQAGFFTWLDECFK